jgi:hypothetical protein
MFLLIGYVPMVFLFHIEHGCIFHHGVSKTVMRQENARIAVSRYRNVSKVPSLSTLLTIQYRTARTPGAGASSGGPA